MSKYFAPLIILLFFFNINIANGQSNKPILEGWDFGMNFGYHLPSSYHAGFYDGSSTNVNNLDYIFGNKYYYDQIRNSLNASDTFFITGMPNKMRYTGAFLIGIYFRRTFDKNFGFSLQFNFSKLKAGDFFQIEVDPYYILTEPDYRLFQIWGTEDRVNIDLNFSKYFPGKSKTVIPFFEAGLNLNSTRVIENKIKINNLEYSIVDVYLNGTYVPGAQQTQYIVQQGGIGWGINGGGGIKLIFNENISIDPGFQILAQKINLEGYDRIRPSFVFYVRLSMAGFFANTE